MTDYRQDRRMTERDSVFTGIVLTVLVHVALILLGAWTGIKYLYPPPQEQAMLIDFEEIIEQDPIQVKGGTAPTVPEPDKTKEINLVKRSESPVKGTKANEAKESTVGKDGDVEVPEPEREIDNRSLFTSAKNKTDKDTLAAQTSSTPKDNLQEGHASGNTVSGKTTGTPNAHLQGRSINGSLPKPEYSSNQEGTVVVDIWVDQYGNVTKAIAGGTGTTLTDKSVWKKATLAALKAHFNMAADAPVLQQGTITYNFKLR